MAKTEAVISMQLQAIVPDWLSRLLVDSGWAPPEEAEHLRQLADRHGDVVEAAFNLVDAPAPGTWSPEVEDDDPVTVAYEHLAGCVKRLREVRS